MQSRPVLRVIWHAFTDRQICVSADIYAFLLKNVELKYDCASSEKCRFRFEAPSVASTSLIVFASVLILNSVFTLSVVDVEVEVEEEVE